MAHNAAASTATRDAARPELAWPSLSDDGKMGAVERVQPRVSFADLERAPEDGRRYELYDGEVYVVPAPMPRHQRVQMRLVEWLDEYAESIVGFAVCAPIDIVFSEHDVLQPD